MRILFALDDALESDNGVQRYVSALQSYAAAHGHEIFTICAQNRGLHGPNIYEVAHSVTVPFNGNRTQIPKLVARRKIKQVLESVQPDVIHLQLPYSPAFVGRLASCASDDIRMVGTYHVAPYSVSSRAFAHGMLRLQKHSLSRIDALIADSEVSKRCVSEAGEARVMPVPIDLLATAALQDAGVSHVRRDTQSIVCLGRLVRRKGFGLALRAFASLPNPVRRVTRLYFIGDGTELRSLLRLSKSLGVAQSVTFLGRLSDADKLATLAAADVALFPSSAGESFGVVLLEAMAVGAAVVASGNPGYREVLGVASEHSCFAPRSVSSAVSLLNRVLSSEVVRDDIRNQQTQRVKEFDLARVGPRFLALYAERR